ncbi:phosphoribosylaminoimidazolesuccinocarboxamide synthase [Companilactobacillus allii]|uniref:Phosphoribosylaminoimidazole-succinocarboxamide synthase n=1 Tax=Companilactobacillus allii TaxID=1847728 RepID=A0A1P8Q432_9LACO|nr:phosphoribosylaminoimidazolesuccinocarboxamide synthase [Companilactobacillus allii]APX72611.1 phosphoribosylaminoimidazolesuccinocarboxamide synthase [Companilactobacillus allii]USQ69715.1 phosphoribosylaminoimidazolesuccinocarboxamide synthase [Companilactobacillus allii]
MNNDLIYSGKAKDLFKTNNENELLVVYKDQATALNGKRKEIIPGKGVLNCKISTLVFNYLIKNGIETHVIKNISDHEQLIKKTEVIPLEVVLRNRVSGSLAKKFDLMDGEMLEEPIIEFYFKSDELGDPFINDSQVLSLHIAKQKEIDFVKDQILKINQLLIPFFSKANLDLIDFKLEFGRIDGKIILVDEFSPDNCRLWDQTSHNSLDKDIFRQKKGDLAVTYKKVLDRIIAE